MYFILYFKPELFNLMKFYYSLFFLMLCSIVLGQQRIPFTGKIVSQFVLDPSIVVENTTANTMKVVSSNGNFAILGQVGDTLRVKNMLGATVDYILDDRDLVKSLVLIPFDGSNNGKVLDEVFITKFDMRNLGFEFSGMKKLTPIEKRLYTATGANSLSLDGLINSFNGKTKMLKKALVYETNETASEKILDYFPKDYLNKRFNIPLDDIEGFVYFLVEDKELSAILFDETKNKKHVEFRISELLPIYKSRVLQ